MALFIRSQILAWIFRQFPVANGATSSWITGNWCFVVVNFLSCIEGKRLDFQEIYELFNFWNDISGAAEISWKMFSNIWVNSARQSSVLGGIWKSRKDFPHLPPRQLGHFSPAISGNSTKFLVRWRPSVLLRYWLIWMTYPTNNLTV